MTMVSGLQRFASLRMARRNLSTAHSALVTLNLSVPTSAFLTLRRACPVALYTCNRGARLPDDPIFLEARRRAALAFVILGHPTDLNESQGTIGVLINSDAPMVCHCSDYADTAVNSDVSVEWYSDALRSQDRTRCLWSFWLVVSACGGWLDIYCVI